jgi:hypothetical protein
MAHSARSYLTLSLLLTAVPLVGCIGAEDHSTGSDPTAEVPEDPAAGLYCVGEPDPDTSCPDRPAGSQLQAPDGQAPFSSYDMYFHPNNGLHGGWIEGYRLCNEGGQNYRICTGGSAPVRYWNPSSCNGAIHDYYPQGWSGWAQTGGGCG